MTLLNKLKSSTKIHGEERNVEEYTPLKIKLYVLYSM